MQNIRCINLDWLEVHAREPHDVCLNASFFIGQGWNVKERLYGTRVYREMFTLCTPFDEPLIEIRRNPASQGLMGIHDYNECHIRLSNRSCYFDNAAGFLNEFLQKYRYYDIRVSRVDICLDFVRFDRGDEPQAFVRRYFRHKYAKINQGRISSHGEDTWAGQEWNSLSWGSRNSSVTTKMYNKTLELYDVKLDYFAKPYIRQAWLKCGMIDDLQRCTKDGQTVNVWRVEFSLSSSVKKWLRIELDGKEKKYQSILNTLECYDSKEKLLVKFASLAAHYFRFKVFEKNVRKDRCEDKILFDFNEHERVYKVGRNENVLGSGQTFKARYNRLIEKIQAYQQSHYGGEICKACDILIQAMSEENMRSDLANPWSQEELFTLRELIRLRTADKDMSYEVAMNEIKKLLSISQRVLPDFNDNQF